MPLLKKLSPYLRFRPIPEGGQAPGLSLTADEGTWVRLSDFDGKLNVLLVFFESMVDDPTDAFLRALQKARSRFEALDTVIFAVNQRRTDRLRAYRARLGLEYYLLYDPFALASRGFGCSHRVRPLVRPATLLVGKDGRILLSQRGFADVARLLEVAAGAQGREVPPEAAERGFTGVRDPGAPADRARPLLASEAAGLLASPEQGFVLVDVRSEGEFASWHVPSSVNIPLDEMPHRYPEIGQTTHIVCVDQSGGLAQAGAEFLTSVGRSQVYYVRDGLDAWPR
jgi:rhodanese-related sulfurtransferase/peroxiredoxin